MSAKLDEPWPIKNALGILNEVLQGVDSGRIGGSDDKYAEGVKLATLHAIEVVKGINELKEPEQPDPKRLAEDAVRRFVNDLGVALEDMGRRLQGAYDDD